MKRSILLLAGVCVASLLLPAPVLATCSPDSVLVGPGCVDKYEASVWEIPATTPQGKSNAGLISKVRDGKATLANLQAGGGIQRGAASDDYGGGCPDTGNGCTDFYAVSTPGVTPSRYITWFQAVAACRNAGKRLLTNTEWQAASLGTPDGAPCIVSASVPGVTGTAGCVSDVGTFDMVGNVWEWVGEWVPRSTECITDGWNPFSDDFQCLAGAATTGPPGALTRGGAFSDDTNAGVFAVSGGEPGSSFNIGFRCAR